MYQILEKNGICTKKEAERLLSFTNNSGPLFIIGTVGISLFYDVTIGFLLFLTHILACITVGVIFRFWGYDKNDKINTTDYLDKKVEEISLGEVLSNSIKNAINTVVSIGGFVVLFSVILSILNQSGILNLLSDFIYPILNALNIPASFSEAIVSGVIELTNGVNMIANINEKNISTNILVSAFVLGFGGFSVVLQVYGIISKTDISIKPYILGKFLQGVIASFYTYIILKNSLFFNLNIPASTTISSNVSNISSIQINNYFILLSVFVITIWLICFCKRFFKTRR